MFKIVAIDDSRDNLITLKALLGRYFPDAEITTLTSAAECVSVAKELRPDLFIIDYIMPVIDGLEACRLLKSDEETKSIPLILLTATDTTPVKRAAGLESGADAFLTKPIDEIELAAQVKAMLRIKSSEDMLKSKNIQLENILAERTQTLNRTENNYKLLFNSIVDIVVIHDLEGIVLEINHSGLEYLGLKEEDVVGLSVLNLFNYHSLSDIASSIMGNSSMERMRIETSIKNSIGEIVPVEVSSRLVEYNNEYAILSVFHDLMAKKNIDELRNKLSSLLEDSEDAIIGVTCEGLIVSWNSSAERIFGYKFEEINGCSYSSLIPPYQPDDFPMLLGRVMLGEKIDQYETIGMTSEGNHVYLSMKISPVYDSAGEIIGASIIERDVTETLQARETIKKGKDFLKSLEDINPAFYIALDSAGNILTMNRAMLIALNYTLSDVVGRNYIELLFHQADRELQKKDFNNMLLRKKTTVSEYPILTKDGEALLVEWHGRPLVRMDGNVDFIFYVGIDITERKRLEKLVMETNATERLKIGQDLHDRLAQHLAGIIFRIELLKVKLGDDMPETIPDIDEIITMVDKAVSKTREIAKELSPVDISPGGLRAAVESLKDHVRESSKVNILVKWDDSISIIGKLENSNLYYIIKESILNSVENNEAENILINASIDNNVCSIEIRADGKDFEKVDKDRNNLFLSLVRYRSWLIGASTEVKGNPGGGLSIACRFRITGEPLQIENTKKARLLKKDGMKNKSGVFLVDSHPIVRQGLKQIFEMEKDLYIAGEAGSADEALKALARVSPDIITVDISLSGTSGIDLIKACRERYPNIPVLVLSIYDESLYAERAIRAGARGFVMKNEHPGIIISAVRVVLDGRQYMSDSLKEKLLDKLSSPKHDEYSALVDSMTDREFEVFQLIGHGLGNKHIADKLHISVKTVENYREKIKSKLNFSSSSELIQFAVQYILDRTS
ncbi:MAG TPA: PAS domain S-box protein [Spirochaetota bacterium]|mgnify:CR=1 FL=1|nr:PAS domain S-box protein [Spirochaetota bacterium]